MDQNTVFPVLRRKNLRLFHKIGSYISNAVRDQESTIHIVRIDLLLNGFCQFTDTGILPCGEIPVLLSLLRQRFHAAFVCLIIHHNLRNVTCSQFLQSIGSDLHLLSVIFIGKIHHLDQQICVFYLFQSRTECLYQTVRQLMNESNRIRQEKRLIMPCVYATDAGLQCGEQHIFFHDRLLRKLSELFHHAVEATRRAGYLKEGDLTVITAAVPVTSILSQDANIDVIQLGGITRSSSVSVVGPFAEQMLRHFNCSKLFVGVDGIDLEFGLTTTNMLEATLNGAMMNAAQKVIVLADSSKFGRRGFSKICDLEAVDRIITDSGIQPLYLERLRERGIEVIVVDA